MCSCNLKTIAGGNYSIADVFSDDALVKSISENKVVSKECFTNKHPLSRLQWINCVANEKLKKIFQPYGLEINDYRDIVAMSQIVEQGLDKQKFNVSFMELLDKIVLTSDELSKTDCIIFC